jgi:cysteine-rich repeat protein
MHCGDGVVQSSCTEQCDDGNVVADDGCSPTCTLEPCVAAPVPGCLDAAQAQLQSSEKTPGKEKLKLQWKKVVTATTQGAFGDPVNGPTRVALCLYDGTNTLIRGFVVNQGSQMCGDKPCWRAKGTKGYAYADKAATSAGITKIGYGSGDEGKGKADAAGANNAAKGQTALPIGVVAALSGKTNVTAQLVTSDGFCVGATMTETTRDDGVQYKARRK